jgi:hypothetical protein
MTEEKELKRQRMDTEECERQSEDVNGANKLTLSTADIIMRRAV